MGTWKTDFPPSPMAFLFCHTIKIKLNILTLEYTKRMCYNAITSKKHSLFTMILYREIRFPKLVTRGNISNIQNLEMEGAMVMTITEMRELKEQSSRSAGSISGKEAGGIYLRGLLCPAR